MSTPVRDVSLKIAQDGKLVACSGSVLGEGYTVLDVPEDVSITDVILQMSKVVIMPLRSQAVPWESVVGKPQGAIVNLDIKTR